MGGRGGPGRRANSGSEGTATASSSLADAILQAIRAVRAEGNPFAPLADIRNRLPGTKEEQDSALISLLRSRQIRLYPEENQKGLTSRDHQASINLFGEAKHLAAITDGTYLEGQ